MANAGMKVYVNEKVAYSEHNLQGKFIALEGNISQ